MRLLLEEAVNQKFIRPIEDLKLTHEEKKVVKKGIIFDGSDDNDDRFVVIMAVKVDIQKTAEREAEANYIFSPARRRFSVFIWITALLLRAVRWFKTKALLRRIKEGKSEESELESLKIPAAKFSVFYLSEDNSLHSEATSPLETRYHCLGPKGQVSTCVQVLK